MSLQMYMRIEGVPGESKSVQHKGWSEVHSWNWGMTSNRKSAQVSGEDKTALNEISIIKPIAADSAGIRLAFAQGRIIPTVELGITPVLGKREVQQKYVYLRLEGVAIKSIITGGGIADNFFKEHITLLFERISFQYSRTVTGGEVVEEEAQSLLNFGWDVPTNVEWAA